MEGVERYKVRLLPHNDAWRQEYLQAKGKIEAAWRGNLMDIQHVGSTAICSIKAKPILDVAVKLKSIKDMDISAMEQLGYNYCGPQGGNEGRHLFVLRGRDQISLQHIHCYDVHEREFALLVRFRDYMNQHPDKAKEYEALKIKLAEQHPEDRNTYTKGKEAFILSIYAEIPSLVS